MDPSTGISLQNEMLVSEPYLYTMRRSNDIRVFAHSLWLGGSTTQIPA